MESVAARRVLIGTILVSAALRLFYALTISSVPSGDPQIYLDLASNIASGEGMRRFSPTLAIEVRALHPPLYPLILSLFAPLGFVKVALVNFLIDLTGAAAMFWLARVCRVPCHLAAAAYLIVTVWLSPIAHKEGLVAAFTLASAAAAIEKRWILLGLSGAMLALTQPSLAPLPALLALAFVPPRLWPLCAAVGVATMLPWWVRNWTVFGAFVPLTTSSGYSFWLGAVGPGDRWLPLPGHLLVGSELGISSAAAAEAWQWVVAHPAAYIWKTLVKTAPLLLLFGPPLVMAHGKLRVILALALLNIVLFQMWFALEYRHLFQLVPLALLAFAYYFAGRRRSAAAVVTTQPAE